MKQTYHIKMHGNESDKHIKLKEKYLSLSKKGYQVRCEVRVEKFYVDVILMKDGRTIPVECGSTTEPKLRMLVEKFNMVLWHPFDEKPIIVKEANLEKILTENHNKIRDTSRYIVWNMMVPKTMNDAVEKVVNQSFFVSRAEFVRDAVRAKLKEYGIQVTVKEDTE